MIKPKSEITMRDMRAASAASDLVTMCDVNPVTIRDVGLKVDVTKCDGDRITPSDAGTGREAIKALTCNNSGGWGVGASRYTQRYWETRTPSRFSL